MHILIAAIGTSQVDIAIHLGILIHQKTGGKLTLLSVIKNKKERAQAEATLSWAKTFLSTTVSEIQTCVRIGQPAAQILSEVETLNCDLLIMEVLIQHGLFQRILEPKTKRMFMQMPCPVLIARGEPKHLQRVLVCDSGHSPSLLNRLIKRMPSLLQNVETLTVLHVMSQMAAKPGVPGWELRADAQELIQSHTPEGRLLEDDLIQLQQLNTNIEAKVRHGPVITEIIAEVNSGFYDLVVIGTHQVGGWEHFLLENLALDLVNQVNHPLLIV